VKDTEINTINNILYNNECDTNIIKTLPTQRNENPHTDTQNQKIKWAIFTYSGNETRKITILTHETKSSPLHKKHYTKYITITATDK
jgi:hypothetical protein